MGWVRREGGVVVVVVGWWIGNGKGKVILKCIRASLQNWAEEHT